jgi:hypothetical protein
LQSVANPNGVAKCYCHGYCHCHRYRHRYGNSYGHSDSHCYGNCDCNPNQYARAYAEVYSKPEASPNAAAPPVGIVSRDYLTLMGELANEPASSPSDPPAARDYPFVARATRRREETFVARDQRPVRGRRLSRSGVSLLTP